ncbi:MAG: hypothetical protein LIR46_08285 [Bacteroidota bacterium]|nr:hypothetical protein [Bacteroidota bacterium]
MIKSESGKVEITGDVEIIKAELVSLFKGLMDNEVFEKDDISDILEIASLPNERLMELTKQYTEKIERIKQLAKSLSGLFEEEDTSDDNKIFNRVFGGLE